MLVTSRLTYRYGEGGPTFRFPDLRVGVSEPALLLGPSGSGKSTWLHLLAGILTPESGSMELAGTDYAQLGGAALDRFRGQQIGLVLQRPYFLEALTVRENLAIARRTAGLPADATIIHSTLEQLGIDRYADRRPTQLSVGEQQRVMIARALVNQPKLILADEPTSALDKVNAQRVSDLLRSRAAELGAVLVVVTHDERLRADFTQVVELRPVTDQATARVDP
ncbi:Lipoprotein-releasing system ATP-binding protein LolD [Neolewinella maritima]|uniref:Lipoprotein-releasing system ATP-binding protein LolD n=1 Tax=Neolewinella maritima TaxID=1383882 RepID=A0ABN8EYR3_9BACT|nr:ATP-binding cassette domain-containing protein [Neolewinella maritima]CAH0998932.1 Lipoprotein-releasing system ATP-binding protein LolD [Neolewinella maritima]